ncbi:MAG: hypothetical protein OXG39_01825 [Chloroflexi bacterium]|nr:hypothetical protein [Chloroflexota bacterium]
MSSQTPGSRDSLLEAADTCQATLDDTSRLLAETQLILLEISHKLDALMQHLGVPYEKPPS